MAFSIDNLFDKIIDQTISRLQVNSLELGRREFRPDEIIDFMDYWVGEIEKVLQNTKGNEHITNETLLSIKKHRGYTYREFYDLLNPTDEKDFSNPAFLFHNISNFRDHKFHTLDLEYTPEAFKQISASFPKIGQVFFSKEIKNYIPLKDLESHCYITARTGHGKTELMRLMITNLIERSKNGEFSVVLLDPHKDFASKLSRSKMFIDNERVVYINPTLREGYTPVFNPLEMEITNHTELANYLNNIVSAIKSTIERYDDKLTINMVVTLRRCCAILAKRKNVTIHDLIRLLDFREDDPASKELIEFAIAEDPRTFAKQKTNNKTNTNDAITVRLSNLIEDPHCYNLLTGANSFDLEKHLNDGSVVIFDLKDLHELSLDAVGRFIISQIKSIILKRKEGENKPVFLFIDEFPYFIGDDIEFMLTKLRAYGLHLVLANQYLNQLKDRAEVVRTQTNVKILGATDYEMASYFANNMRVKPDDIIDLPTLEFVVKSGNKRPVKIKIPTSLFYSKTNSHYMSDAEYEVFVNNQLSVLAP